MNWQIDKVLPIWTVDDEEGFSITVRRHGHHRFGWDTGCEFQIPTGIDHVSGTAPSLKEAKRMAEAAVKLLESEL